MRAAYSLLTGNIYEPSDLYDPSLLADDAASGDDAIASFLLAVSRQMTYWKITIQDSDLRHQSLLYWLVVANPGRVKKKGGGSTAAEWSTWLGLEPWQAPIAQRIAAAGWQVPAEPRPK